MQMLMGNEIRGSFHLSTSAACLFPTPCLCPNNGYIRLKENVINCVLPILWPHTLEKR